MFTSKVLILNLEDVSSFTLFLLKHIPETEKSNHHFAFALKIK